MIGIDIVKVERIRKVMQKHPRFLTRIFSAREREYLSKKGNNPINIAGFFAAKEAAVKVFGGNIKDFEVLHDTNGRPYIHCKNGNYCASISHEREFAVAICEQAAYNLLEEYNQ